MGFGQKQFGLYVFSLAICNTTAFGGVAVAGAFALGSALGSEFPPQLDEGTITTVL